MSDEILDQGYRNISPGDEAKINRLLAENAFHKRKIGNGRIVLIVLILLIAGLTLKVLNIINDENSGYSSQSAEELLLIAGLIIFGYLGSLLYSFKNPKEGFIIALMIYIGNQIYSLYAGANLSLFGIILRVAVVIFLSVALKSCYEIEKNKRIIEDLSGDFDEEH